MGKRPTVPGFHFWKAVLMRRISYHSRRSARMPDAHKRGFLLSPPLLGKNREKLRRFACICAFSSVFFYCTLLHDLGSLLPVPPPTPQASFFVQFFARFQHPARPICRAAVPIWNPGPFLGPPKFPNRQQARHSPAAGDSFRVSDMPDSGQQAETFFCSAFLCIRR